MPPAIASRAATKKTAAAIATQVMAAAVSLRAGRLLLRVHGRDHGREELAQRGLQTLGERCDVVDHRFLVFLVRHTYPCTAMRMKPVTITFAIASGSSTFQPSRISMS